MVRLDRGRHGAADAQAVAAHQDWEFLACFALVERLHVFAVLGSELEDMPDLDSAGIGQVAVGAAGAAVSCDCRANVPPCRHLEIDPRRHIARMGVRCIRPDT